MVVLFEYHRQLIKSLEINKDLLLFILSFSSIKQNDERVKFVLKNFEKLNLLKDIKYHENKSNKKSTALRLKGNKYFLMKDQFYWSALELYNKSICYAEIGSINLAMGYANRSAAYFELQEYDKCLENIKLARDSSQLPQSLNEKLKKRENNCLSYLTKKLVLNQEDKTYQSYVQTLSYPPHSSIPFAANCLELRENKHFGRFLVTNQELKAGDCIIIEEPFLLTLDPNQTYKRCAFCRKENLFSLIPCKQCTGAMFCNDLCYESAFATFHKFECSAVNALNNLVFKTQRCALRVVLLLFSNIQELDKIKDFVNTKQKVDPFEFDYNKEKNIFDTYKLIHSLESHVSKRSNEDLAENSSIAAIIYKCLKQNVYLKEIFKKDSEYEKLFLNLLFHNLLTMPINYQTLTVYIEQIRNLTDSLTYGSGVYPLHALINNSCAPNVKAFTGPNTEMILYAWRNICKGEQLFICYGTNHYTTTKSERQLALKSHYLFECRCKACQQNFPTVDQLRVVPNLTFIVTEKVNRQLAEGNLQDRQIYAKKVMPILIEYLRKHDHHYPASQIYNAQEALKGCINTLFEKKQSDW